MLSAGSATGGSTPSFSVPSSSAARDSASAPRTQQARQQASTSEQLRHVECGRARNAFKLRRYFVQKLLRFCGRFGQAQDERLLAQAVEPAREQLIAPLLRQRAVRLQRTAVFGESPQRVHARRVQRLEYASAGQNSDATALLMRGAREAYL